MTRLPVKRRETERNTLGRIHDEVDDLFSSFFSDLDWPAWGRGRWPALDISENDNEFIVKAEVPGCKAEDIDISVNGNMLTISGEKKQEKEETSKGCYHVERSYGNFRRDLNLATDVDASKIEAACKDGVLTVTLPKTEKSKAVKIEVKQA
jgi:HSP20 family protein